MTETGAIALAGTTPSSASPRSSGCQTPIDFYPGRLGGALEVTHV
jgi:hypothetical protein